MLSRAGTAMFAGAGREPPRPGQSHHKPSPSSPPKPANLNKLGAPNPLSAPQLSGTQTPPDGHAALFGAREAAKHRRTRSGCYTCRNRRVKCDETSPVCRRCIKGKRECIYPDTPRPSLAGQRSKYIAEGKEQGNFDVEGNASSHEALRGDDSDSPSLTLSSAKGKNRLRDVVVSLSREPSFSLSLPASPQSRSTTSQDTNRTHPSVHRLRPDLKPSLRFYIDYHLNHMSYHHYGMVIDARQFVQSYLIPQALANDALLYAVVAFAAYHHAVRKPDGRMQEFLRYYSQSLSLLRESLERTQERTVADLLTMLQLSMLEEHMGDWNTLLKHQQAAFSILTTVFTPDSLEDDNVQKIIEWYVRFDLFAAFISGTDTGFGKEWFEAQHRYYVRQVRENPDNVGYIYDERNAAGRALAKDVSALFHRRGKAAITDCDLVVENNAKVLKGLRGLSPFLNDSTTASLVIYGDDLFPTNHMFIHFWSIELVFRHHLAILQRKPPATEVASLALRICQMFEAVELYDTLPGAVLAVHAAYGIASVYLRKELHLIEWFRRKQALIETNGYIYPTAFRHQMSNAWDVDVNHWWLDDDEGYLPILRAIREFVQYRTDTSTKEEVNHELRDMRGVFESLTFNDP